MSAIRVVVPLPDHPYYLWQMLVQSVSMEEKGIEVDYLIYVQGSPSPLLQSLITGLEDAARPEDHLNTLAEAIWGSNANAPGGSDERLRGLRIWPRALTPAEIATAVTAANAAYGVA